MHDELKNYIESMREKGFGDDDIRSNLEKEGWSEKDINEAFEIPHPPKPEKIQGTDKAAASGKSKMLNVLPYALPLLLLAIIVTFSYIVPLLSAKPSYSFIYSERVASTYHDINVEDGVISVSDKCNTFSATWQIESCLREVRNITFYMHNIEDGTNTRLTLAQVQNLRVIDSDTAPDGYKLQIERYRRGFLEEVMDDLFLGSSSRSRNIAILEKGRVQKEVDLAMPTAFNLNFIGWVE